VFAVNKKEREKDDETKENEESKRVFSVFVFLLCYGTEFIVPYSLT